MSTDSRRVFDILPVISNDDAGWGDGARNLLCPICGHTYNHMEAPVVTGTQGDYAGDWHGRGALTVIPMWSECGSKWELCMGFHKGETCIFARVKEPCKRG